MAYSWLRQWAHTKMAKLPPECVQIATALIILWKTVSTDTPSHIGTQWLWTKSPADWLTRTASCLSTRCVWAKGCIYFRGIYGPCCAPATHTSTSQDTRPQGLQVAAHGKRAGWDKVRRCRVSLVHCTTQISQSQPPLTTKGSGDLGSISSHEDPTPIGDAGCPWEWPPTDVTPRDITLEGLPPPSPAIHKDRCIIWCAKGSP